jgi:peptidyl-prolyl cis-trans isomerase A (cyclophilin A)
MNTKILQAKLTSKYSTVIWIYLVAFVLMTWSFKSHSAEIADKLTNAEIADKSKAAEIKTAVSKNKKETKQKDTPKKGTPMFAIFETNKGNIKIKLFADKAPKTVENFVGLAEGTKEFTDPKTDKKTKRPFYDGLVFHRVIPNFMIQGGCPLGTGTGDPGYRFGDEFDKTLSHDKPGKLSMANAGPGTNGSQFFITVAATPWLDGKHTIFGEVVEGYENVEAISKVRTSMGDKPVEAVVLKHVKIVRE